MRLATLEDARKAYIEQRPLTHMIQDMNGPLSEETFDVMFTGIVHRYNYSDSDEVIVDDLKTFKIDTTQMHDYLFSLEITNGTDYDKIYICKNGVLTYDIPRLTNLACLYI